MTEPAAPAAPAAPRRRLGNSALVATGILVSRIFGIVREMLRARAFGATGDIVGDVWTLAIRIPNLLQNLLGEGVLSSSFIPVYARQLADGDEEEAGRLAGAVLAILTLVMLVFVAIGILAAPLIVDILANTWTDQKYDLAVRLVRILFPGAALFVLAAWCIGVLNSHRRFLLPYLAPVFWNLTMIAAFVFFAGTPPRRLIVIVAWASVIGAGLQFFVQVPAILRLVKHLRVRLDARRESVRKVLSNFGPIGLSRGVVQISGFVDLWIANQLPNGAPALLFTAQTVNMLPVSLFGMAVSASELPELSSVSGTEEQRASLIRGRIAAASRRIAFFVIPSAVAFVALGDVIIRVLFERRAWTAADTMYTWAVLAGSAFGLLASTVGRLYSSAFYAMHDTRRPLRFALIRVALTVVLGYIAAIPLTNALMSDHRWGTAGLTFTAGIAGWVEFWLLRRALQARIGEVRIPTSSLARLWAIAAASAVIALGVQFGTAPLIVGVARQWRSVVEAMMVLGAFGGAYLGITTMLRVPEAESLTKRFLRR
jgi:putative peptidoglycan lipid II flippase